MSDTLKFKRSPALLRGFSRSDDIMGRDCCEDDVPWWDQPEGQIYLAPKGFVSEREGSRSLAGGGRDFIAVDVFLRGAEEVCVYPVSLSALSKWSKEEGEAVRIHVEGLLNEISKPRPRFAGLSLGQPKIMGVLNVTPDSFSDGGEFSQVETAISHGLSMRDAGAHIIDIGGESTRPGAAPVSLEEEAARVIPVVRSLVEAGAVVSIDTRHPGVMQQACEAGAAIINDVSALTGDTQSLEVAAKLGVPVILMHMRGEPGSMQTEPVYGYAPLDVYDHLAARLRACERAGMRREMLCVDVGIGFGKTDKHNLQLLNNLSLFHGLGCPQLLGASRKSMIGRLSGEEDPKKRLSGSLACALSGVEQGVQILRVHDVVETVQAVSLNSFVKNGANLL